MQATVNVSIKDFIVYGKVYDNNVHGVKIVHDAFGLYSRNYDALFTTLIQTQINNINNKFANGYDLRQLNQNIGFIAGMFINSTVTPFQEDGFLYAGLTFFTDSQTVSAVNMLQEVSQLAFDNKETIRKVAQQFIM
jgi:hypothetical protein